MNSRMLILLLTLIFTNAWSWRTPPLIRLNTQIFSSTVSTSTTSEVKKDISYIAQLWRDGYQNCGPEVCEVLSGNIPTDLVGSYFRYDAVFCFLYLS
jgi:hypothetical protein